MQAAHEWILQGRERAIWSFCQSRGIPFGPESDPRDFGDSIGPCGAAGRTKKTQMLVVWMVWVCGHVPWY